MKKILFSVIAFWSMAVNAETIVPVIWPFSNASNQAIMLKELIREANSVQKKYVFVYENRPGAGGAIAVNHSLNQKTPVIIAHSSSYFIRPYMNREGAYDIDSHMIINGYCNDLPMAFLSRNISNFKELDQKKHVTIGVLFGNITQLPAVEYAKQRKTPVVAEVGYKGTPEITLDVLAGNIDVSVDFLSNINDDRLKVLAITGQKNIGQYVTFSSQGLKGFENLTTSYYLFINRQMNPSMAAEFMTIFAEAAKDGKVNELCQKDFGTPVNINGTAARKLFENKKQFWHDTLTMNKK